MTDPDFDWDEQPYGVDPDFDVCECEFGEGWDYHLMRKYKMVKSVSELVLNEVNKFSE